MGLSQGQRPVSLTSFLNVKYIWSESIGEKSMPNFQDTVDFLAPQKLSKWEE